MPEPAFDKSWLAWSLPWDADWITAVSFIGPRHIAAGNNRGEILVWELPEKLPERTAPSTDKTDKSKEKGEAPAFAGLMPIRKLLGHTNVITRLLAVENRWLISASNDHTIRYWDMQAAAGAEEKIVLNARTIEEITNNKNSGRKPPAPLEATVKTQSSAKTLQGKEWITGLSISADQSILISGDDAGQVVLWDRVAGTEKKRWSVKGWAFAVAISPDHKQALVSERYPLVFDSGRHTAVKLWDVDGAQVQHDLSKEYKDMQIASAAYSPDGRVLAIGRGGEADGMNGKIYFLDPANGKRLRETSSGHQYGITDLCFHPNGLHLASSGRDTVVRITTIADAKIIAELGKPRGGQFKDWIHAISFSPDGMMLAAADMDGLVHVWSFTR